MKMTLSTYDIADALKSDTNANWSYNGAKALAEYLEECEESSGEEMELDVVAIRCDFSEHGSLREWADDYGYEYDHGDEDDDIAAEIREYITDHGRLIEFDGGVIVSWF